MIVLSNSGTLLTKQKWSVNYLKVIIFALHQGLIKHVVWF